MELKTKNSIRHLLPGRLAVLLLSLLWLGFYFLRRGDRALMNALCDTLVRPWHRIAGKLFDRLPFSVAEWLIALGILLALLFLWQLIRHFLKRPRDWRGLYRWAMTLLALLALLFALFCLWWGVYYYADSFSERSGLEDRPISAEQLESVTRRFAELANRCAPEVRRDDSGLYAANAGELFEKSASLYREVSEKYPCLAGPELHAKPVVASRLMSYLNNTGFFCPYTAEANLNVDAPLCMLPATIAHELAHQRGVAREDEANFVAVLSCLENGDADYVYSAALFAYTYLGNALHKADYAAWREVYESLSEAVKADLHDNNTYWQRFETPVKEFSDEVYTVFLQTYGDDRGMQSYGACVDLLVAYYYEAP